jgi:hypothetical protein
MNDAELWYIQLSFYKIQHCVRQHTKSLHVIKQSIIMGKIDTKFSIKCDTLYSKNIFAIITGIFSFQVHEFIL